MKARTKMNMPVNNRGFSLIELMITMVVVLIVLTGIVTMFASMTRQATTQNVYADLQQAMRATLAVMADDIRMAGYDPNAPGSYDFKVEKSEAFRFHFTANLVEDDQLSAAPVDNENVTYLWAPSQQSVQKIWSANTGQQTTETLLGGTDTPINVIAMSFLYLDAGENPTTLETAVRGVVVTLTAESPAGRDGMVSRTMQMRIECRNAGV